MILNNSIIGRINYQQFVDLLPGKKKVLVNVSSISPDQILRDLDQLKNVDFDTEVMLNVDTWFFHQEEEMLFAHPVLKNKNVIIQTIEYESKYLGNNHWRIAFPVWYNQRTITKNVEKFHLKERNLPYGFGSLNNRPALHRLLLGVELYNRKLLDSIVFVQNNTQSLNGVVNMLGQGELDARYVQDLELLNGIAGFNEYVKLLPLQFQNHPIENIHYIYHYAELKTYCNITTESVTEMIPYEKNITLPEVSEKSHKAFLSCQVPLFLAAPGHNAYFKGLGFELMEDLTEENFDLLHTRDRIRAIADVVAKGRDFIAQFYFEHLAEIKHNHELICSDKTDRILFDRVKEIL